MRSLLCAVSSVTQPGAVGGHDLKGVKMLPQPSLAQSYGLVLWGARREALQTCGGLLAPSLAGPTAPGRGEGPQSALCPGGLLPPHSGQ